MASSRGLLSYTEGRIVGVHIRHVFARSAFRCSRVHREARLRRIALKQRMEPCVRFRSTNDESPTRNPEDPRKRGRFRGPLPFNNH